jgi:hypothetical protein
VIAGSLRMILKYAAIGIGCFGKSGCVTTFEHALQVKARHVTGPLGPGTTESATQSVREKADFRRERKALLLRYASIINNKIHQVLGLLAMCLGNGSTSRSRPIRAGGAYSTCGGSYCSQKVSNRG